MKLTPEQLRKIKMLALHPSYNTFTAETVNLLIADLEEAQEQLASPYMDGYEAAKEEYRPQIIAAEAELAATRKQLEELRAEYSVTLDNLSAAYESVRAQWNLGYAEGSQEVKHWRANHDNVVAKLRLFTQREDLPVDRLPAYEYVVELEKQLAEAQALLVSGADLLGKVAMNAVDDFVCASGQKYADLMRQADSSALQFAIAEAVEPYRKDAACWQFARKELSWSRAWFEQVRWAMYIEMDAPNITAERVTDDSVARELDAAVLAAIAARKE